MSNIIEKAHRTVRNWWVSVAVGILAIALGIYCLAIPAETFMGLSVLFEIFFFAGAILELVFAISNRRIIRGWGWILVGGLVDLLLAVMLLSAPQIAVAGILVFLVAFWLFFRAIWAIGASIELQGWGVPGWGWMLCLGIALIALSIWFIRNPLVGATAIVWVFGLAIILYGCFRCFVGIKLGKLHKSVNELRDDFVEEQ